MLSTRWAWRPQEGPQQALLVRLRSFVALTCIRVDRQTKASYATYEAAEKAGKAIKKDYPILQVAVTA
jgi:hypothetical protein